MNKIWTTILLTLAVARLVADDQQQMTEAAAEYTVGDPEGAFERYQALLPQPRPAWQRSILLYNMATTQVAQGQFAEAIALLKAVPLDQAPNPLLAERVSRMLVWSYWQQGVASMKTQHYSQATASLREALAAIPQAEQAHCALQQAEGAVCSPAYEEWRRQIEAALRESENKPSSAVETPEPAVSQPATKQDEKRDQILKAVLQMEQEDVQLRKPQPLRTTEQRPW